MSNEVISALEDLERQKGIPKEYMLEKVEAALLSAVKKEVGGNNVRVAIDREKGAFHVYRQMTVVEEVTIRFPNSPWRKQRSIQDGI